MQKSYKILQARFNYLNKSVKDALKLYGARAANISEHVPNVNKLTNVCKVIREQLRNLPSAILNHTEQLKSLDRVLQTLADDLEATGGKRVQVALILSSQKCDELLSAIRQLIPKDAPLGKFVERSFINSSGNQV